MNSPYTLIFSYELPENMEDILDEFNQNIEFSAAIMPIKALESAVAASVVAKLQSKDCAVLISTSPENADQAFCVLKSIGADGLHLETPENFKEIREKLPTKYMAGVFCGLSRHDTMTCGEQGAEYIAYGGPDLEANLEFSSWFEEVMTLPGMALQAQSTDEIARYIEAGSDFVAFGDYLWESTEAVKEVKSLVNKLPPQI